MPVPAVAEKRPRDDDPSPLPSGWIEAQDPRYDNTTYWYHADTKQTSWSRPTGPPADAGAPPLPPAAPPANLPSPEEVELILDDWVKAKRAKDFETADRIRDGLRAQGVDPDIERPNDTKQRAQPVASMPAAHHNPYAAAPPEAQEDLQRCGHHPPPPPPHWRPHPAPRTHTQLQPQPHPSTHASTCAHLRTCCATSSA